MSFFYEVLYWILMGIAIGLGILSVTILAIIVAKIYYKFFPAKSEIEKQKDIMKSYYESSPNILLMNRKDYYPQSEKIKSQIKKARADLWKENIILPTLDISLSIDKIYPDKTCVFKINNKEIFQTDNPDFDFSKLANQIINVLKNKTGDK